MSNPRTLTALMPGHAPAAGHAATAAAGDDRPHSPVARDVRPPPPGFGRWPWWTPFVALAAALLALAVPVMVLRSVDFPFRVSLAEALFGVALFGFSYLLMYRYRGRPHPADVGLRATPSRAAVGWVLVARITYGVLAAI